MARAVRVFAESWSGVIPRSQAPPGSALSWRLFVPSPRLCLGLNCLGGSAASSGKASRQRKPKSRQSLQDTPFPGGAWERGQRPRAGGACKTLRSQAEPGTERDGACKTVRSQAEPGSEDEEAEPGTEERTMNKEDAFLAIRDSIQHDVGNRGLARDPAANLITACPDDFAAACRSIAEHPAPVVGVVTGFWIPDE